MLKFVAFILLTFLLLNVIDQVSARPHYKPYLGLKQLAGPAEVNGKFAKQSFSYEEENGLRVALHC
jgi:hypothetical protein